MLRKVSLNVVSFKGEQVNVRLNSENRKPDRSPRP